MKEPQKPAQGCVIWMHGLGADAADMAGLADQLLLPNVALRHVFMNAPKRPVTLNGGMIMPAWYDILGMELVDRVDKPGIAHAEQMICEVMATQIKDGFTTEQLFLAGFSQGGAMALHTALNYKSRLGGVIALSAYLPLGLETQCSLDKRTPFFMAGGQYDPMVLPVWTQQSHDWIIQQGYSQMTYHRYPMEHTICMEEVRDLSQWMIAQVQGAHA